MSPCAVVRASTSSRPASTSSSPLSKLSAVSTSPTATQSLLSWPLSSHNLSSYFTVVNLNVQGLLSLSGQVTNTGSYAKIDFLRNICCQLPSPDIIFFQETKLASHIDSTDIDLPLYTVHRRD